MAFWAIHRALEPKRVVACSPAPPPAPAPAAANAPAGPDRESVQQARGLGYAARLARIAQAVKNVRLVAYTSDVGESLRPVIPRWAVTGLYGVSFAYVGCDVYVQAHGAIAAKASDEVVARTAVETLVFQLLASIAVPSLIIHKAVHAVEARAKTWTPGPLARWAPPAVGLAIIPVLPYVVPTPLSRILPIRESPPPLLRYTIDEPIEPAVEAAFDFAWPPPGGKAAHRMDHKPKPE